MTSKLLMPLGLAGMFFLSAGDKPSGAGDAWTAWEFVIGDWVAEGGGKPGEAAGGGFSFTRELDGEVLVRKNRADYPAANGRPAFSHEDLMVVYKDDPQKRTSAVYFDNEGHVIHYAATLSDDGQTLTFLSDPTPSTPRFRLIYAKQPDASVRISFEMAPPGGKDFSPYTTGTARRK